MKLKSLQPAVSMLPAQGPTARANPNSWRDGLTTAERGYGSEWQTARAAYLKAHPLCSVCDAEGITRLATIVDHTVAHRGDKTIFWNRANWASMCKPHHDSMAQRRDNAALPYPTR